MFSMGYYSAYSHSYATDNMLKVTSLVNNITDFEVSKAIYDFGIPYHFSEHTKMIGPKTRNPNRILGRPFSEPQPKSQLHQLARDRR